MEHLPPVYRFHVDEGFCPRCLMSEQEASEKDCFTPEWANTRALKEIDKEKFQELTMDFVDDSFPKGKCKERGSAIVLYANILHTFCTKFGKPSLKLPEEDIKMINNFYQQNKHLVDPMCPCEIDKELQDKIYNDSLKILMELGESLNRKD